MSSEDRSDKERAPSRDSEDRTASRRQLRNYLLDREYQLKHVLILLGLVAALSLLMGLLLLHYIQLASRVVEVRALDPTDELARALAEDLKRSDLEVMLALGAFDAVLLVILFGSGIIFTHRVAGPLYKISIYMNGIREGRLGQVTELRKGDQLRRFFESFQRMHAALRARAESEARRIEEARGLLAEGRTEDAQAILVSLHAEKRAELS